MSQCHYVRPTGQCPNEAEPPGNFCPDHSAVSTQRVIAQYQIANKLIGDSAERHVQADQIKSVIGEIALLRALLEGRINRCEDDATLDALMPQVKDFALAIDKLATSCHAMDVKLGNLIGKQVLISLAQEIAAIISNHIRPFADTTPTMTDVDEAVEKIGLEVVTAIASKENSQ